MQVTLNFHGDLRRFCPDGFVCVAHTVADAINLFFRQHKEAARNLDGTKRLIQIAGCLSPHNLTEPLDRSHLDICPAFCGAGGKQIGIGQIILGAILIAVSFIPGMGAWAIPVFMMGLSMVLGGALALLSPTPRLDRTDQIVSPVDGKTPEESRYLGAAKNTTAAGTRIPICYGRFKRAGHILSFDVEADPEPVLGQPPNADQRRRVGRVS